MKMFKNLREQEIEALPVNSLVYVTCKDEGLERTPAFTLKARPGSAFVFVAGETDMGLKHYTFSMSTFDTGWTVEVEFGFTVQTPDGVLHAFDGGDGGEYPGIRIDLIRSDDEPPIALAMTEYIPGGEGLCGYDPEHPGRTQEEIAEVPLERIVDKDGNPVKRQTDVAGQPDHYKVTAGLVSRAWPDEIHEEDYHRRVFHFGYKD